MSLKDNSSGSVIFPGALGAQPEIAMPAKAMVKLPMSVASVPL